MVLNFYGRPVSMPQVLTAALDFGAFDPSLGWRHGGLVEVLQSFGLTAYRRNWRLLDGHEQGYLDGRRVSSRARQELSIVATQMIEEGLWTIRTLLAASIPVIVSVYRPWQDSSSVGHQIVLVALEDDHVVYHDPADRSGAANWREVHAFVASWKGTAIVAHKDVSRPRSVIPSRD